MNTEHRSARACGVIAASVLCVLLFFVHEIDAQAKKGASKKPASPAEEVFEEVRAEFEASSDKEAYERMPILEKMYKAPCKKAVDYLVAMYARETNPGFLLSATRALGLMGTEESVKAIVLAGLPVLVEPSSRGGLSPQDMKLFHENLKSCSADFGKALLAKMEPKAEEWIIKNGLTPVVRRDPDVFEMVIRAIANLKSKNRAKVLLAELKRAETASPGLQAAILDSLQSFADEKTAAAAAPFVKSKDIAVQIAAYDVVGAGAAKKYRGEFVGGLKNAHWQVRVLCIDALLKAEDKDLVKLASEMLKDPDSRCRIAAVEALRRHGGEEVIEPLIRAIDGSEGRVQDDLSDALASLTGKNFGPVSGQWDSWWAGQKGQGGTYVARSPDDLAKLKEAEENQITSATPLYFGLRVLSLRVGFVIDCSESMNDEHHPKAGAKKERDPEAGKTTVVRPEDEKAEKKKAKKKGPSRLDVAKRELLGVLGALKEGAHADFLSFNTLIGDFAVVLANAPPPAGAPPAPAPAKSEAEPKKQLPKLSPKIREEAKKFIQAAKGEGATNILLALRDMFDYPEVDTIYLLSDGAPTVGVTDPDELLLAVSRMNRLRKVKINAISFEPGPDERKLLKAIAEQNYGVYVER